MRVAVLQHVPFEGLGSIEPWLASRRAEVGIVRLFDGDPLPDPRGLDWVIALGGPMSVNDESGYPWLRAEKRFLREAIEASRTVLGICLGAQLIANALGARVYPNREKEIGWLPIEPVSGAAGYPFASLFARPTAAFHWHGETFDLPPGAMRLAGSAGCENQAFSIGDRVLGLQFHLETTPGAARALLEHCADDLVGGGRWVQGLKEILGDDGRFERLNGVMATVLGLLEAESLDGRSAEVP